MNSFRIMYSSQGPGATFRGKDGDYWVQGAFSIFHCVERVWEKKIEPDRARHEADGKFCDPEYSLPGVLFNRS